MDIQYKIEDERHKIQMRKLTEGAVAGTSGSYSHIRHSPQKDNEFKNELIIQIKRQLELSKHFVRRGCFGMGDALGDVDAYFSSGWVCEYQNMKKVVEPCVLVTYDELEIMLI